MTLLELVFALAIVAALVSFSWPLVQAPLDRLRLRRGAEQLRIACGTARSYAIEQSDLVLLEFEIGSDSYRTTLQDEWVPTSAGQASMSADAATRAVPTDTSSPLGRLPEGVVFAALSTGVSVSADAATPTTVSSGTVSLSFQPDGSTEDATVWLRDDMRRAIAVTVRGLTGATRAGEVIAAENIGVNL
jgi:Tfp pilus assembly protein FimT